MILKCKMCGGDLSVQEGENISKCTHCGTQQTIPKMDDEKRVNLYNRANHFRQANEYDKALGVYETILHEDATDAEAYWQIVLCKYGIQYVEDPKTHERIPTINRVQSKSVTSDPDYKQAIEHAAAGQAAEYEKEAKAIDGIRKSILAISKKEEPFDVFICYKDTDDVGERTKDSVRAQELYQELTKEGMKVFFSRITLESRLGAEYEPYIFAALQSAKVMVVVGTNPTYLNSPWVKNEWSRYLALIDQGENKKLIPVYQDMDAYSLPEELLDLQAYDMSRLGFVQDLILGIKKIMGVDGNAGVAADTGTQKGIEALFKKGLIHLEFGEFIEADECFDSVLDIDPEYAPAYVGRLCVELECNSEEELGELESVFTQSVHYQKAKRFGDEGIVARLEEYVSKVAERIEEAEELARKQEEEAEELARKQKAYGRADEAYDAAVASPTTNPPTIKDLRAKTITKDLRKIMKGVRACQAVSEQYKSKAAAFRQAVDMFNEKDLNGFEDSDRRAEQCEEMAKEADASVLFWEARASKTRKVSRIAVLAVCVAVAVAVLAIYGAIASAQRAEGAYNDAQDLYHVGNMDAAREAFAAMADYKDSQEMVDRIDEFVSATTMTIGERYSSLSVGDIVTFGSYGYDRDALQWRVLAVDGGRALILSNSILGHSRFDSLQEDADPEITWENSELRELLNTSFLGDANLSPRQKATIQRTELLTSTYRKAGVDADYVLEEGTTTDMVFALSIEEVDTYFKSNEEMIAGGDWWLRTVYFDEAGETSAVYITHEGRVYYAPKDDRMGIRPAMWVSTG